MSRHDEAQALPIRLRVNGASRQGRAEPRMNLADFLRGELGMTGTTWAASMACAAPAPCWWTVVRRAAA